jgi:hypothetical protein
VGTNDGFDVDLADANAVHVSRLTPGTYDIVVRDRSRLHNFHLASNGDPTVDFRTELDFVGEMTFTVTFRDETRYAYACEPALADDERRVHRLLAAASTSSPAASDPEGRSHTRRQAVRREAQRRRGQLPARRAGQLAQGQLPHQGTRSEPPDGTPVTGTKRWTVELSSGRYRFGSDPRLTGTLTVR